MNKRTKNYLILSVIVLCIATAVSIIYFQMELRKERERVSVKQPSDLEAIKAKGELVVLTMFGPTSYFNYRDEMMGFQYELSKQFAKSLGVKLTVKVAPNIQEMRKMLLDKKGDLIAYTLPITKANKDSLLYCGEELITHQVLVQRQSDSTLTDVTQLPGKDIYVKPGKFEHRLQNLDKELGGGINIHKVAEDSISADYLILKVSNGEIDYTVCENDIARLNRTYYNNLNINLAISFDQRSSWAVRTDEPQLAKAADEWYRNNVKSSSYLQSARRYFDLDKTRMSTDTVKNASIRVVRVMIMDAKAGQISLYDEFFKKYSKNSAFDWRLIASIAYQESTFDPTVESWAGAKGLMQLMPRTAQMMGLPEGMEYDPEQSIKASTKYLSVLNRQFRGINDLNERMNFILASYNGGIGHVLDAMALAKKYGYDSHVWDDNVEKFILLKSNEIYYTDSVCKNGYFRGRETYNFVREIRQRYEIYKKRIKE